ncbi:MAG: ribbon-helix-helix domain-containing protein [Actinomycetota bacterium]|nr:ribbon-helix-helix domain-containing protein [Actinomycetota bacterium]
MATMTRRLQVLLDEDRYARLEKEAARRGTSVATLVREAIDAKFPGWGLTRAEAARQILDGEPLEVGDWEDLKEEILTAYDLPLE